MHLCFLFHIFDRYYNPTLISQLVLIVGLIRWLIHGSFRLSKPHTESLHHRLI
jgi:hypothetical protein